jgi:hypothetical protein
MDKINTKIGTAVNAVRQGNLSACHRFISPTLAGLTNHFQSMKYMLSALKFFIPSL